MKKLAGGLTLAVLLLLQGCGLDINDPQDVDTYTWTKVMESPDGAVIHGIAFPKDSIWMSGYDTKTLYQLNPDLSFAKRIALSYKPTGLACQEPNLWITSDQTGDIQKLDQSGALLASFTIPNPGDSTGLFFDGTSLWNTGFYGKAYKLGTDGAIQATIATPTVNNECLAVVDGKIYINDWDNARIVVLDLTGKLLFSIPTPFVHPLALGFDGSYLWVSSNDATGIYKTRIR